ncbi:Rj2 protein [Senna tora]|uniref:Rj2 protein n=1 Tax=Senna tora TaxID=362788 RepID=A0A834W7Q0_9FABA|nr:Rj2 protein [Senna tora]
MLMIRLFLVTFKGTDEVEVIIQKSWNYSGYSVQWNGKAFKKMRKLKVLIIENVSFCSGVQYLPNSLRFLEWVGYPSPCLPPDFRPKKLSLLNLEQSCISSLKPLMASGFMDLNILNLDDCKLITQIPDISCFPNLTELSFRCCDNLVEVHDSVGFLDKLRILRACSCPKLRTLPPLAMSTLEKLRLRNCSSLEAFPDILGEKKKITELDLDDTDLVFPSSIQNLTGLRILDMQNCRRIQLPIHIAMLPELELLHIRVCGELLFSKQDEGIEKGSFITCPKMDRLVIDLCNISDESLSLCLSWFVNVKTMSLLGSNFTILPACINKCPFLTWLDLENCKHLREIRGVPPNIQYLSAKNCTSLSSESTSILLSEELHNTGGKIFSLPQATIPEWFDHRTEGGSISFWFRNKFPVLVVCVVIGLTNEDFFCIKFDPHVIINGNNRFCARGFVHTFRVVADHIFVFDLRSIEFSDKVEDASLEKEWNRVEICYGDPFDSTKEWVPNMVSMEEVGKESGIYVLKEINKMEDIRFTNPYMDNGICSHALSEQGYSTGPDSSDSIDTEEDLSDTSVNHVELQLKRRGKMKVDDNLPSQAEAETIDTQFLESRVNIGLVHVLRKEDKSLSWDGMEGEDQVLCLKNKPILNDQCTMCERDKDGMGCESSKQRRHSRHRCLRALLLFSFVALFLFFFDSIMISSRLYPSSP